MNEELLAVYLTKEQAALFILFQKNYHTISFMIANGVFDLRRGKATINFDASGDIDSIDKHTYVYRNQKPVVAVVL